MVVGQIGETGAHEIVITALEQELGTEHDLAPTHHHIAMECKRFATYIQIIQKVVSTKQLQCSPFFLITQFFYGK